MNIGIDLHDTLSYMPEFFVPIIRSWDGKVFIVTGTPPSRWKETVDKLQRIGLSETEYTGVLMGFEYDKTSMNIDHFRRMRKHKLHLLQANSVRVYIDDNPFYADYIRNHDIKVLQPILSSNYVSTFGKQDPFFSCHLQLKQFDFLEELEDDEVTK